MKMIAKFVFLLVVIQISHLNAQSITLNNFNIKWNNRGGQTDFEVNFILDRTATLISLNNIWIGVGVNRNPVMVIFIAFNKQIIKLKSFML